MIDLLKEFIGFIDPLTYRLTSTYLIGGTILILFGSVSMIYTRLRDRKHPLCLSCHNSLRTKRLDKEFAECTIHGKFLAPQMRWTSQATLP